MRPLVALLLLGNALCSALLLAEWHLRRYGYRRSRQPVRSAPPPALGRARTRAERATRPASPPEVQGWPPDVSAGTRGECE